MARAPDPIAALPSNESLKNLFDCPVEVAQAIPEIVDGALYPEELRSIQAAVPKRRAEFGVGRLCARRALAALGVPSGPLLPDAGRAPVWPAGVTGSITHTSGYCAAAVALASSAFGLGLDAERDLPLDPSLEHRICTEAERRWLDTRDPADRGHLGMLFFSAKEAFYKCQYPTTRTFLEFADVELVVRPEAGRFEVASIRRALPDHARIQGAQGRFRREGGLLLTAMTCPALR